ncbi:hypothetical protein [Phenylobacterium aquaticum]|uniref:hypothetical protein n=1 Tax=Phenylobacterium aquaticum TaxID=1763816 RepID=UPI001F5E1074|nr:hypothetical protein [Phenylobacterium aquaticum]MCI3133809.1 hypothetical protein [Phenylobacterium aquaticum]
MGDYGLVVESFSAPPGFAESGVTGPSLAEQMRARIGAIRQTANAHSVTVSDDVRSGEGEALKVEVPETGVSLDEIDRYLHRHLGHARRLEGEVTEEEGGRIRIETHLSGSPPISVEGDRKDLDALLQRAAEQTFAHFDPVNWVIYLRAEDRNDEALAAADVNVAQAMDPINLASALSLSANSDGDRRRALAKAREVTRIAPQLWSGWHEFASASQQLGHDADAVAYGRHVLRVKVGDQLRYHRQSIPYIQRMARIRIDKLTGDYPGLLRDIDLQVPNNPDPYSATTLDRIEALAGEHDCAGLDRAAALGQIGDQLSAEELATSRWRGAVCREDRAAAAQAAREAITAVELRMAQTPPSWRGVAEVKLGSYYRPQLALAEARAGNLAAAQALIATTPLDCYLCVRVRGQIAALTQNWPEAERWFDLAIRQAPDLPFAYEERGRMLAARGDLTGAIVAYRAAHKAAPNWADPLEGWGEALARQGHRQAARGKYDQALSLAPAWARLRALRDAAA